MLQFWQKHTIKKVSAQISNCLLTNLINHQQYFYEYQTVIQRDFTKYYINLLAWLNHTFTHTHTHTHLCTGYQPYILIPWQNKLLTHDINKLIIIIRRSIEETLDGLHCLHYGVLYFEFYRSSISQDSAAQSTHDHTHTKFKNHTHV